MKYKKGLAVLLTAAMVVAFTACGGEEKDVAAKIEDTSITTTQLSELLELSAYVAGQDLNMFRQQPELMKILEKSMLTNMVSYEAMRLALEEKGTEVFPEDYDEKLKTFKESMTEQVKQLKISDETLTYYFNLSYYAAPYNEEAANSVTDADVRAYYDEHIADRYTLTGASGTVGHILVTEEALANEIYDKLMGGADFAEMAKEYGTDGTKDVGGTLGTLVEDDANYDADFMKGAFALKSGEISKPVKTQFGYHIIKMDDRKEAGAITPFEGEKENIKNLLASEKLNTIVQDLVKNYKVEYFGEFKDEPKDDTTTDGAVNP